MPKFQADQTFSPHGVFQFLTAGGILKFIYRFDVFEHERQIKNPEFFCVLGNLLQLLENRRHHLLPVSTKNGDDD